MSKFTAGTWEAEFHKEGESDPGWWSIEAEILGKSGSVMDSFNRHHCVDPEEDRANAMLIAAAPDLLKAVKAVRQQMPLRREDWPYFSVETMELLETSIAKAQGGAV